MVPWSSDTRYIEIAERYKYARGRIIPIDELSQYYGKEYEVYHSVYLYTPDVLDYVSATGSVKGYNGVRGVRYIYLDIDKKDNSDERTLIFAREIVSMLLYEYMLDKSSLQPFYSGTGYHIAISADVFGLEPSDKLPIIIKHTIEGMFDSMVDLSIYSKSAIIRCPHTLNTKSLHFKIPLSINEMFQLNANQIKELAKGPRLDFQYQELTGNGELSRYIVYKQEVSKQQPIDVYNVAPCITKLYNAGPIDGSRNNTVLRIASHFRRNGIPYQATLAAMLEWNKMNGVPSLDQESIEKRIKSVYNAGYTYGCNDELLSKHCSPLCIYYKRKNYGMKLMTIDDLHNQFIERINTDFEGRMLDLSAYLTDNVFVYPGELLTIYGPTGMNKSTLAQCIALGYNPITRQIESKNRLFTIFFSLELAPWFIHLRNLQIVSGLTEEQVTNSYHTIFNEYRDLLDHILVQSVSPNIDNIKSAIQNYKPRMIILDYIELINETGGDYERLSRIMQSLRNIASTENIIIIAISQVSREYAKPNYNPKSEEVLNPKPLDLHAGKGTGAIENSSSKVIGIWGSTRTGERQERNLQLFKNTNGLLCGPIKFVLDKSLRLNREV